MKAKAIREKPVSGPDQRAFVFLSLDQAERGKVIFLKTCNLQRYYNASYCDYLSEVHNKTRQDKTRQVRLQNIKFFDIVRSRVG
jgi:hypothetical protein